MRSCDGWMCCVSSVTVPAGKALNIQGGTTVRFASGAVLNVDGQIKVTGTLYEPVVFDSNSNVTFASGSTVTVNPGVTITVEGTLTIASGATITGGGSIVTSGSGKIFVTNSASALAANNSRKLARDGNGNYHLVFETDGEVCYEKLINGGTAISEFRRLSNGVADGVKSNPAICVRDNNVLMVWQKNRGSSHDITFHKSTDGGATWPGGTGGNRKVIATLNNATNPPLPVIVSPATNEVMVVYRTASNLSYQTSSNYGDAWSAVTMVPSTGIHAAYQSMAVTTTYWGSVRTALVNTNISGNGTIYYRYYKNGPDSTGWASLLKNLSQIVPGSYNTHQKPVIAPSGSANDKRLHVAWEARSGTSGNYYVIIHRKATDWYTWPNVYSATYYEEQQQPSITGLHDDTAELLFRMVTQNQIYKMHYDGTYWGSPTSVGQGNDPSVSVGNTTAKYIWTEGSSAPYQIKTSSETLSKTGAGPLAMAYHRSVAIIDTTTNAWLEVRLDKLSVKTRRGEEFTVPFANAKEDSSTLTPANAFTNLASSPVALPADAESLAVYCQVSGQGLSAIKNAARPIVIELVFSGKNGATLRVPIINFNADGVAETRISSAREIAAFAGNEVSVRTEVSGPGKKSSLIASLGHIYEIAETPLPKVLESITETAAPQTFFLEAYPNPFSANGTFGNPSTQIRFTMKDAGVATLRVYNLNGQLVRELLREYRAAGEHTAPWDGRDERNVLAASGVYFIRFEAGNEVRMSKVMLVR